MSDFEDDDDESPGIACDPDAIMSALVRSYDGEHQASIQFDPPIYRADGRWHVWLMVADPKNGPYSVGGATGPDWFEALRTLAHIRGLEIKTPDLVCDVCGKTIDDGDMNFEYKLPGGLVLDVCSSACSSKLDGPG
jgi:hypothetical protein